MKYLIFLFLFFSKSTFSQTEFDYSYVVNDYFNRCYNDPKLKEDGNYLIVPGEESKVSKDYILYISYLKGNHDNLEQSMKRYFKKQLDKAEWDPANLFNKLVNTKRFDTSYMVIKNKNTNCIGGLVLRGIFYNKTKHKNYIYLNITKFNSKHSRSQADFLVEYAYMGGKWKFVSEKMLSIT